MDQLIDMTNSHIKTRLDPLLLYIGDPYPVTEKIIIYQPTIDDIILFGEKRFYDMVNVFIANTTMYRLALWDMGMDWNKVSDFELFSYLIGTLNVEDTKILFGEIDFTLFKPVPVVHEDSDVPYILYNEEQGIVIDQEIYTIISNYIRTMLNIFPKAEKAKGKATKEAIIWEEREKLRLAKEKDEGYSSILYPMISSCLNHPGFKYNKNELRHIGIVEFMDSVQRLQIYESTTALLKGVYSGMVDTKNIDSDEFNFMRDLSHK